MATFDLATTRPAKRAALDGKRARFRIAIINPGSVVGGRTVSACAAPPGSEGTVFLPNGEDAAGVLVVEARLAVLPMQEIGADGRVKRQFTSYRLTDAVRVGP